MSSRLLLLFALLLSGCAVNSAGMLLTESDNAWFEFRDSVGEIGGHHILYCMSRRDTKSSEANPICYPAKEMKLRKDDTLR